MGLTVITHAPIYAYTCDRCQTRHNEEHEMLPLGWRSVRIYSGDCDLADRYTMLCYPCWLAADEWLQSGMTEDDLPDDGEYEVEPIAAAEYEEPIATITVNAEELETVLAWYDMGESDFGPLHWSDKLVAEHIRAVLQTLKKPEA